MDKINSELKKEVSKKYLKNSRQKIIDSNKEKIGEIFDEKELIKSWISKNKNLIQKNLSIIEDDGIWYFGNMKGEKFWENIDGISIKYITSQKFNKNNGIGNEKGYIRTSDHIRKLFEVLGLKIASKKEENDKKQEFFKLLYEQENLEKRRNIINDNIYDLKRLSGLRNILGIWYFGDCKGLKNWPKLNGKNSRLFPDLDFNRKNGIGNNIGQLNSIEDMKLVFKKIGLKVANDEEEKNKEKEIKILNFKENEAQKFINFINKNKQELETKIGIQEYRGKWYFINVFSYKNWQKINGISLRYFPNPEINKLLKIGNESGIISSAKDLKKIFEFIGLKITSDIEENEFKKNNLNQNFKNKIFQDLFIQLTKNKSVFTKTTGVIEKNGILYFCKCKSIENMSDKILGIPKISFPSLDFNRSNGIGNPLGQIRNIKDFKKVFEFIGFTVASDKQEEIMLDLIKSKQFGKEFIENAKKTIIENKKLLEKTLGIKEIDGIWELGGCKGWALWPEIGGINLTRFPSVGYNKSRGIGNKFGIIKSLKELEKMLNSIGFETSIKNDSQSFRRDKTKKDESYLGLFEEFSEKISFSKDRLSIFGISGYKTPLNLYINQGSGDLKINKEKIKYIKKEIIDLLETDIKAGDIEKVKYVKLSVTYTLMLFYENILTEESIRKCIIEFDSIIFPNIEIKTSKGNKKIDLLVNKNYKNSMETCDIYRNTI